MLDYRQLVAPDRHAGVLVAPDASTCALMARENRRRLDASDAIIFGSPLRSWRKATRAHHGLSADKAVVAVGHQPDFVHPGVWAKGVVAHRLAEAIGGTDVNLVVDSDAPKRLVLRVPVQGDRFIVRELRAGAPKAGLTFDQIAPLSKTELRQFREQLREAMGAGFDASLMTSFLAGFEEAPATDWVSQMLAGRREADAQFGYHSRELRVSNAWWSPLAAHLLLDGRAFAMVYNESLAKYREDNKVRSANRPIPDLAIETGRCEAPFWVYKSGQPRRRAFVGESGDQITVSAETETVTTMSRSQIEASPRIIELIKKDSGWLLRPRALITTIWARLFLADLFIHGIGGAKYDRISDAVIRGYFRIQPPDIACVTATLYLFPPCAAQQDGFLPQRQFRDAVWNPQRHVSGSPPLEMARLMGEKKKAIARSEQLRQRIPKDHSARRNVFASIRNLNQRMQAYASVSHEELQELTQRIQRARADRQIACDREYFFALYSRDNLNLLLGSLPAGSDFVPIPD